MRPHPTLAWRRLVTVGVVVEPEQRLYKTRHGLQLDPLLVEPLTMPQFHPMCRNDGVLRQRAPARSSKIKTPTVLSRLVCHGLLKSRENNFSSQGGAPTVTSQNGFSQGTC